jgi:putative spermidine/putrescine transport system substrate-binding protein
MYTLSLGLKLSQKHFKPLILSTILIIIFLGCSKKDNNEIVVVSWGGQYQDALFNDWVLPSAKNSKINIIGRSYTGEYKNVTRMIESKSIAWDLIQVETFYAAEAMNSKLLEKFDPPVPRDKIVESVNFKGLGDYAFPTIGWSYVLAWNNNVINKLPLKPGPPQTWKDFWDVKKYPGKRALRNTPQGNIEIALFADGLSGEDIRTSLYEKNDLELVDRALKKLDQIKKDILWWKAGDQIQRDLESGNVVLAATWNGRVWLARRNPLTEPRKTFDVQLNYNQAILDYDWWIIPKGSKHIQEASRLINGLYDNMPGAIKFANDLGYGPPIKGWEDSNIDKDLLKYMPTTKDNSSKQLVSDPNFWQRNHTEISEKWQAWQSK